MTKGLRQSQWLRLWRMTCTPAYHRNRSALSKFYPLAAVKGMATMDGRGTMKVTRMLVAAAALILVCSLSGRVAKADGVDPKNGLGGTGSCGFVSETSLTQTVT